MRNSVDIYEVTDVNYKWSYKCNLRGEEMDKLISKITDSEVEIIKVLWKNKEAQTISDIRRELEKTSSWESSTIKTLLRRLCEKGAVGVEKREMFYYSPLISEKEYNDYITKSLIDRLFSGSAKNLVASLIGSKRLKANDIDELKNMFKVGEKDE